MEDFLSIFYLNENNLGLLSYSRYFYPLIVNIKVYNEIESLKFLQYIPAYSPHTLLNESEKIKILHLLCNENFRINIGFSNFDHFLIYQGEKAKVKIKLFDYSGKEIVTKYYAFNYLFQVYNIFKESNIYCDSYIYYAEIEAIKGNVTYPYASLVNNITGDCFFVPF